MFYHSGTCWLPMKKKFATASVVFIFFLLVSALVFLGWVDIVSLYSYIFFNPYSILSSAIQQLNLHTDYTVDLPFYLGNKKTCNGITKKSVKAITFVLSSLYSHKSLESNLRIQENKYFLKKLILKLDFFFFFAMNSSTKILD